MNPARLVDLKDLAEGTKYRIRSITLLDGETSIVHLQDTGRSRIHDVARLSLKF